MNKQQYVVIQNVHAHKRKAYVFKEKEKMNDINRENTKILNKLVEISKGKLVRNEFLVNCHSLFIRYLRFLINESCYSLCMGSNSRTRNASEQTQTLHFMGFP